MNGDSMGQHSTIPPFVRRKLYPDIIAKGDIAAVCESRHSRVLNSILESDETAHGSLGGGTQKFNNLVGYWHKLHQKGQFARVHDALFPNEDQDQRTHTAQPSNSAESDVSSDINNSGSSDSGSSDSDSNSNSSSKNSPEQPRRNLLSTSNFPEGSPRQEPPCQLGIVLQPEAKAFTTLMKRDHTKQSR
eukprot:jgi/Psemu1/9654/gm1.9654_g